ncbi:hypothetical protein FPE01S_03_00480 [Flavihumibacter petaseus NBRC 106054]|uniref:DUF481 domain-containing protein n=2 Tax=Flavihumibacter TaxID=1004301 RepID=A0A0E9N2E4_9BACT|nr:hypothetical protein FPE01S_03_00480 [Flavihumibacter petaseus NBRC 106054]
MLLLAQKDSVIFKNGNTIVGEMKSLNNGVLTMETSFSKNDFTIKWSEIRSVFSDTRFLITLADGRRINGNLKSRPDSGRVVTADPGRTDIEVALEDIVFIKGLKSDFWSRAKASIDVGMSLTKANNLRQFSVRSAVGYLADRWQLDANFNTLFSKQDSVEDTKRTDAAINYKYFLQHDWYLGASLSFLSNTEQALRLRTTGKIGGGKLLKHTNKSYWGVGGGLSVNNESFTNETPARNSLEAYAGTELNLFDIGDLSLLSSWYVYPSLTESGRWRSDFSFDAKYEFWKDFYFRAGTTVNYDNQPAVAGKETDFVFQFTVGWSL